MQTFGAAVNEKHSCHILLMFQSRRCIARTVYLIGFADIGVAGTSASAK